MTGILLKIGCCVLIMLFLVDMETLQGQTRSFNVIGFYTAKNDQAHISFVQEANKWFHKMGQEHQFIYDSTSNWNNLNASFLKPYQVVLFLDTRPENAAHREAFKTYIENGGAWMGFH